MKRELLLFIALALLAPALARAQTAPQPVRTEPVKRADFTPIVMATGTVTPVGLVEVGPQVPGTIVRFGDHTDYRDPVDAGQLLVQLDDAFPKVRLDEEQAHARRLEAELNQAKAKLDAARSNKDPAGIKIAEAGVQVAEAALAEGQASLNEAKLSLDAMHITAPAKGTILARGGEVGQAVGPNPNGSGLFLIWPTGNRTQIWANVSETDIAGVQVGQPVQFACPGLPGKTFTGKVARIRLQALRSAGQGPVQYTVEIDVDNASGVLLPYLSADVRIATEPRHNALLVPNAALEWVPQSELLASMRRQAAGAPAADPNVKGRRVWVLRDNAAKPVEVQLGRTDGRQTEVTVGSLKEGDAVIVEGSMP
jgi:HlyD family secretion protein